jgi:hypothetical protein
VAKAVRPLARETSAGADLKRERAARFVRAEGSAPPGRVFWTSAQAHARERSTRKRAADSVRFRPRRDAVTVQKRATSQGADRGSGRPSVVLADCVDCRSRRAAHGPRLRAPGLASTAPARSPSGVRGGLHQEAKRRRVPVEAPDRVAQAAREPGRGSALRWKAPWFDQAVPFDEEAVEAGLAVRGSGGRPRGHRRAPRVATEGVRGHVACSVRGRQHRGRERLPEGLSIAAPPGPGGAVLGWDLGPKSPSTAEEVATKPKLEVRRQSKLHLDAPYRRAARLRGKRSRESMDPQGARVVSRLQKSVDASFSSPVRRAARRAGSARDSLKRPPSL